MHIESKSVRSWLMTGAIWASAMMVGVSAKAQTQEGLVNLNIDDVTVQIPVTVAANICGVSVDVLTSGILNGPVDCQAGTIALANDDDPPSDPPDQSGLINVNITNVDVQAPIAVAANVCGVSVDVLTGLLLQGPVDCNAFGRSAAVSE
jgi:uncharacterized membrane protein